MENIISRNYKNSNKDLIIKILDNIQSLQEDIKDIKKEIKKVNNIIKEPCIIETKKGWLF